MNAQPQPDLFSVAPHLPPDIPHEVYILFDRFTLEAIKAGLPRYSADAVLHRIRWSEQIERGNRAFKANNNWTAPLARWFLRHHPQHAGFFELRGDRE